jgi:hypothetical protein
MGRTSQRCPKRMAPGTEAALRRARRRVGVVCGRGAVGDCVRERA